MDHNDAHWKQKYLASLDKYEKKEKAWKELEELLRLGMNRVALAAQGVDEILDRQLKTLRKSIRSGGYNGLENIVEEISTSVKRLDERRQEQVQVDIRPATVLINLINSLHFPSDFKSQLKKLRKQIQHAAADQPIDTELRELATLINAAFSNPQQDTNTGQASDPATPGASQAGSGLLTRWFKSSTAPTPQYNEDSHQPAATSPSQLSPMHQDVIPIGVAGFCLQLLETLQFPPDFDDTVQELRDKIVSTEDAGFGISQSTEVLNDIADLITATRHKLEQEKQDLQEFLRQMTDRLKDIDQHLAGAESHTKLSFSSSKTFGDMVEAQMKGIESSVQDAAELSQLKSLVQNRLEAIRTHILTYQEGEEKTHRELLDELAKSNARLHDLELETEQLRARLMQEHAQAIHDKLTGIYNRLAYEERITQELQRWKRYKKPLVLLVFDVDHFKSINDTYGHKAGDKALKLIAQTLQKNIRASDFLARYGGEEFVVLMPETDITAAVAVANKLRESVQAIQFNYQEKALSVTISCGATQLKKGDTPDLVFQRADSFLYQAKQAGRNRCFTLDKLST